MVTREDRLWLDDFVKKYLAEMADRSSDSQEQWELLDDMIDDDPEKALQIIVALTRAVSEIDLSRIGAGPLEEFLVQHPEYAASVVDLLPAEPRLGKALAFVRAAALDGGARNIITRVVQ